ncbi:MAG TPA: hypothetical protein VMG32_13075 [Anaeromyxobacteraceae bacterium]|nr:hypothetical protein [Anaeromyxobacteraceae bacterium]
MERPDPLKLIHYLDRDTGRPLCLDGHRVWNWSLAVVAVNCPRCRHAMVDRVFEERASGCDAA